LASCRARQNGYAALKQTGRNITEGSYREKGKFQRTGEMHKLQAFWHIYKNYKPEALAKAFASASGLCHAQFIQAVGLPRGPWVRE